MAICHKLVVSLVCRQTLGRRHNCQLQVIAHLSYKDGRLYEGTYNKHAVHALPHLNTTHSLASSRLTYVTHIVVSLKTYSKQIVLPYNKPSCGQNQTMHIAMHQRWLKD